MIRTKIRTYLAVVSLITVLISPIASSALDIDPISPLESWIYKDANNLLIEEKANGNITTINKVNNLQIITPRLVPQFVKPINNQSVTDIHTKSMSVTFDFTIIKTEMQVSQFGGIPLGIFQNFNMDLDFFVYNESSNNFFEHVTIPISKENELSQFSESPQQTFTTGKDTHVNWKYKFNGNVSFELNHNLVFHQKTQRQYELTTQEFDMRYYYSDPFGMRKSPYVSEFVAYISSSTYFWFLTIRNPDKTLFGSRAISNDEKTVMEIEYNKRNTVPVSMKYKDLRGREVEYKLKSSISPILIVIGILVIALLLVPTLIYLRRKFSKDANRNQSIEVTTHRFTPENDLDIRPPKDRVEHIIETRECCKLNGSNGKAYCNLCGRSIPQEWIV